MDIAKSEIAKCQTRGTQNDLHAEFHRRYFHQRKFIDIGGKLFGFGKHQNVFESFQILSSK
jgi:hypothetical protein